MDTLVTSGPPEARLLGLDAAAGYLSLDAMTIRRLIARGCLNPVRITGVRRVLIDREDLDRLITAGKADAVTTGTQEGR
jgi:excisionase family DNA binding protein